VTGLVPSAIEGTGASLLERTPMSWASLTMGGTPTSCITWAVIVFLEYTRPSRMVMRRPVVPVLSVGRQVEPFSPRMVIGVSTYGRSGVRPRSSAAA
jgi:hypothetical protein